MYCYTSTHVVYFFSQHKIPEGIPAHEAFTLSAMEFGFGGYPDLNDIKAALTEFFTNPDGDEFDQVEITITDVPSVKRPLGETFVEHKFYRAHVKGIYTAGPETDFKVELPEDLVEEYEYIFTSPQPLYTLYPASRKTQRD